MSRRSINPCNCNGSTRTMHRACLVGWCRPGQRRHWLPMGCWR
ncbi:hypothetical protein G5B39_01005 [Rhodobacteraceae bacterium SC52]|nr:hypothetical protein G5B39_01005 [Rhodobacteraceae bacterium SC52]